MQALPVKGGTLTEKSKAIDILIVVICLLAPASILTPWENLGSITDFPNYFAAAKMIAFGQMPEAYNVAKIGIMENAYFPELSGRVLPFFMFPALAWCFVPLAWLPYKFAFMLWSAILFGALLVAFFLSSNLFGLTRRSRMWAAAALGASGPCLEAIRTGQLSTVLLLALVLVAHGFRRRNEWLTAAAQSLFWLKPHLLLPILCFGIGSGRVKSVLLTFAVGIAGGVVALIVGGIGILDAYGKLVTASDIQQLYMGLAYGPTLRGQLLKLMPEANNIQLLVFAAYALVLITSLLLARRAQPHRRESVLWLLAVVVPLSLAFSPHLHNYDLILIFPGLLGAFASNTAGSGERILKIVACAVAFLLSLPVYVFLHYYYVLRGGLVNPFFLGMVLSTLVTLTVLSRLQIRTAPD